MNRRAHERECLLSEQRLRELMRERYERPLPRRFYKHVSVRETDDGHFAVLLDERPLRTPLKRPLHLPARALAEGVAAEWRAQKERINPAAMPLTGLANAAIDKADADQPDSERAALQEHVRELAAYDALCYRADEATQGGLARRQREIWDALLARAERELGARLTLAQGIMPVAQPPESMSALMRPFENADPFTFIALFSMATLSRSAVLALAVARGWLTAEQAWHAATLEEQWNMELWGEDAEAAARMRAQRDSFLAAARFLALLHEMTDEGG